MVRLLLASILSIIFAISLADAQSVYKWTDADGNVHFSTSAPNPNAAPAALPELRRESVDARIEQLKATTPATCSQHGGVDCSRGADFDGSVVCFDGFSDAILPFRVHCSEARLRITEYRFRYGVSSSTGSSSSQASGSPASRESSAVETGLQPGTEAGDEGTVKLSGQSLEMRRALYRVFPLGRIPAVESELLLSLRNVTGVEAYGIEVRFLLPNNKFARASGPERIEPFGVGEFVVPLDSRTKALRVEDVVKIPYQAKCTNCVASVGTRQFPSLKDVR